MLNDLLIRDDVIPAAMSRLRHPHNLHYANFVEEQIAQYIAYSHLGYVTEITEGYAPTHDFSIEFDEHEIPFELKCKIGLSTRKYPWMFIETDKLFRDGSSTPSCLSLTTSKFYVVATTEWNKGALWLKLRLIRVSLLHEISLTADIMEYEADRLTFMERDRDGSPGSRGFLINPFATEHIWLGDFPAWVDDAKNVHWNLSKPKLPRNVRIAMNRNTILDHHTTVVV